MFFGNTEPTSLTLPDYATFTAQTQNFNWNRQFVHASISNKSKVSSVLVYTKFSV